MDSIRFLTGGAAVAALACLYPANTAEGALLFDQLETAPDIASGFLTTNYDADVLGNTLTITGFALTYDDDGSGTDPIAGGSFDLSASITDAGLFGGTGAIDIGGSVGGFGPSLLTGDLTDFGFVDGGGDVLQFLFTVTGGDLAADYGGIGEEVGVNIDVRDLGYTGDWTVDFVAFQGVADTAPVPAPGVLALVGIGLACTRRRRR